MKLVKSRGVSVAVAALWVGACGWMAAEEATIAGLKANVAGPMLVAQPRLQPEWGTAQLAVRTIHGLGFQESESTMTFSYHPGTTHRYRTSGVYLWFDAALSDLPAGALITGLELEGCDTNAAESAGLFLFKRASPTGATTLIGSVSTGDAETPGCAFFGDPMNLAGEGQVVDNRNNSYFVRAELTATDSTTSLGAARVYYRLQVSPSPAVATFADVPTDHVFFRFVEAMAASGITGGCGGGNYCPNNPVTRGQMAVFLSIALGLSFPY